MKHHHTRSSHTPALRQPWALAGEQRTVLGPVTTQARHWLRRRTIVVAMADEDQRAVVASVLIDLDCRVVEVANGTELVDEIANAVLDGSRQACPRLIVADGNLPGCSGSNLIRLVQELGWEETSVVLLSGPEEPPANWQSSRRLGEGVARIFIELFGTSDLRAFCQLALHPRVAAAFCAARWVRGATANPIAGSRSNLDGPRAAHPLWLRNSDEERGAGFGASLDI